MPEIFDKDDPLQEIIRDQKHAKAVDIEVGEQNSIEALLLKSLRRRGGMVEKGGKPHEDLVFPFWVESERMSWLN